MNRTLVDANNRFGLQLFQTLAKKDNMAGIFISPTSLALALQMACNGANGTTQQAMTAALHLQTISPDALNRDNAALLASLTDPNLQVELCLANSLWVRPNFTPFPDFVQRSQSYYGATLGDLSRGAAAVNAWVNTQTKGKIPTIINDGDAANSVTILANAVYFKGAWQKQFEKYETQPDKFTKLDGTQQDCQMMHQSGSYDYFENAVMQAVRLPYRSNRMEMVILLPRPGQNFEKIIAGLKPELWNSPQFARRTGEIGLPRFKTDYEAELSRPLAALGMDIAFDGDRADFSRMFTGGRFYIGFVKHKTYLDVNEEGTEAAAATALGMRSLSERLPTNPFEMIVNRPFVCAIRDNQTGALLFVGAIVQAG